MTTTSFPSVVDRSVQYPSRVRLTEVAVDTYDVTPVPGTVTAAGTVLNKAFFDAVDDSKQDTITSSTDLTANSLAVGKVTDKDGDATLAEYIDDEWCLGDSSTPINATDAQYFTVPQVNASGAQDQAATKQYVDELLPTKVNGKYLHTNSSTGALEWNDVTWGNITGTLSNQTDLYPRIIPSGGTTGQVLKKTSGSDYDVEWGAGGGSPLPSGGTQYQVLAKSSSTDYDATWMGKAVDYNDYSGSASVPALPIANGGTGATTAAAARTALDVPSTSQLTAEQNARIAADADLSDDISDLTDAVTAKYTKPATGIPKTDLASAVQEEFMPSGGTTGQVLKKVSGTDYDVEWLDDSEGTSVTLLWTNSNPTSSYAAFTQISIPTLYTFDLILIIYKENSSYWRLQSVVAPLTSDDMYVRLTSFGNARIDWRLLYTYNSNIIAQAGKYYGTYASTSATTDDNLCIPYKIYGIKGVD